MEREVKPIRRRVHSAEFKAQVLGECRRPGAAVAAVALAHGLNANLVHKWLAGRGLERAGLSAPLAVMGGTVGLGDASAAALAFVPVALSQAGTTPAASTARAAGALGLPIDGAALVVELRGRAGQLAVHWPAAQAEGCAAWLRELGAAVLGR